MKHLHVMTIRFLVAVTLMCVHTASLGQTIHRCFDALPLEYTPMLTASGKDSLRRMTVYEIPGGDSLEMMRCTIGVEGEDYIFLDYGFTTGQNGFLFIELRSFTREDGGVVLVYSKYGGFLRSFEQHELVVFDFVESQLTRSRSVVLPSAIDVREFHKANTPESILMSASTGYRLNTDDVNCVEYFVFPQTNEHDNWIEHEVIQFMWDGDEFVRLTVPE